VLVTPVSSSGVRGDSLRASTSSPITLPIKVHSWLREWLEIGQKRFMCVEGDKERQVLFTREKLKLRDKGGSTKDKSEGYTAVSLRLDPDNALAFGLSFPHYQHVSACGTYGGRARSHCAHIARVC